MASGWTTTSSLADSIPSVIVGARQVREHKGVVPQLADRYRLGEGIGLTWNEISMAMLTAQAVGEDTELDNPQEMSDSILSITPTMVAIHTFVTDRVKARISKDSVREMGSLAQNAIQRKKDSDGIVMFDAATTSLNGAGTTLNINDIANAAVRITSNATEPGEPPIYAVLHGYQIYDLFSEITAALGTYEVTNGVTADALRNGWRGKIHGVDVFEDGNITIDSSDDAKGGVFAKRGLILVEGASTRVETRREPQRGGGGESVFVYDEYAYGERSAGNWCFEIYSDATAPS